MQFVPNQIMGYDRAITVFSPDGRLLQVEYAKKAVSLGASVLGIVCKNSVILMADRHRTDKLLIPESVKKIFKIESNIISTSAGLISDARVLVKRCRLRAQQHKVTYGENINVESLVKYVADLEQAYTQYGGIRPFGISFLIAGVEQQRGPQLYLTEPSGIYFKYKAKAVGLNAPDANRVLEKGYKENMDVNAGLKLSIQAFKKALGKDFSIDRLETAVVNKDGIKYITAAELRRL